MPEIVVGEAVGAGFGLIRRRPLAVLLWGAILMAALALGVAVMAPAYATVFTQALRTAGGGGGAPPDMTALRQTQGAGYLINFLQLFVATVVNCAISRAVIHPERSAFAYLRVGGTEMILFAMVVGETIALVVAMFILILLGALIVGVLVGFHATWAAAIVGVLAGVGIVGLLIYLGLRFVMVGPMMVDDGQVHFLDAWALTKGRTGSLFLIALCVFAILLVGEILVLIVAAVVAVAGFSSVGFSAPGGSAGGGQAIPALLRQPPDTVMRTLTPFLVGAFLIGIPLYGAVATIIQGPWARAYLALRRDPAEAF